MPKRNSRRTPSYRHHKPTDQAVVTLCDRDFYLGRYGTTESRAEYNRLLAEWLANGRRLPGTGNLTVNEMLVAFLSYANDYYRDPDSNPTAEMSCLKTVMTPLRKLYGHTPAADFGPLRLQTVRQHMIELDWSRTYTNRHIGRIKLIFKWAASQELVPPSVHHALATVAGLKAGRSEARETDPVKPAPQAHVDAIKPHVSRQVWAIVQLQLFTGARPGELVKMRPCDLNTTGKNWTYTPPSHKTAYRGHGRTIYLGPRGREVVRPFLAGRPVEAFMFSPAEAEEERRAAQHAARKTPMSCGNRPGTNQKRKPKRRPNGRYSVDSYRKSIERACEKAKVPHWHPHQLMHLVATNLRKEFGIDVARIILGHRSPAITELYAEVDHEKATEIIERVG